MTKKHERSRRWYVAGLIVFTSACPGDDPSSCGYIGWGGSQDSAGTTQMSTSSQPGSTSDASPPTTAATDTTGSSMSMGMSTTDLPETLSGSTLGVDPGTGTTLDPTTETTFDSTTEATLDPTSGSAEECMFAELAELVGDPLVMPPPDGYVFTFVSPNGDDDAAGTPSKPKASVEAAIAAVQGAEPGVKKVVFLCTLNEKAQEFVLGPADGTSWPVLVPADVSIVGGMYCGANVWSFPPSGRNSRIRGLNGTAAIGRALVVGEPQMEAGDEPALLSHIDLSVEPSATADGSAVYGEPADTRNGGSAIGVIIAGGVRDLLEVKITTADAGHGRAGESESCDDPAMRGASLELTEPPTDKCVGFNDLPDIEQTPPLCANGFRRSMGGSGGAGGTSEAKAGKQGMDGESAGGLKGGDGGLASLGTCNIGGKGKRGEDGPHGVWAEEMKPFGLWTIEGYKAESGKDGEHGDNGSGAGGGGGATVESGPPDPCGSKAYKPVSGGQGGGGACGGGGGVGGGSGGSSTGIVSLAAAVRILDSQVVTGNGGNGGAAGCRQEGGVGGKGQSGGVGTLLTTEPSCAGNVGGDGGHGGFAGGGMGGHSIGVAYTGVLPVFCGTTENSITNAVGGAGGMPEGDAPPALKLAGSNGKEAARLKFEP